MNKDVMNAQRERLYVHVNNEFVKLEIKLRGLIKKDKPECENLECFKEMQIVLDELTKYLAHMAHRHGIDTYDFIEEVLVMSVGNIKYARKVQQTAEAFKDDKQVGIC